MLLYVAIGGLHQIPTTIHNKDFVIHIAFLFFYFFYNYLTFYVFSYNV